MELSWIDLVGGGLIAVFLLLGFVRGLWWQVIRAIGLVAAVFIARAASPEVAPWISTQWPDLTPRLVNGIAWCALFLVAMVAATLLGILGRKLLQAMQLGLMDRMGGAVVGAVTGLLLHTAFLVVFTQVATEDYLAQNLTGTTSEKIVDAVGARWPVVLGKEAGSEVGDLLQRLQLQAPAAGGDAPGGTSGVVR